MSESKLIFKKMSSVMKSIGHVGKDQKNLAQGFKFRGIDQFVNALHPALIEHGVIVTMDVLDKKEEIREVNKNGSVRLDKHVSLTMKYTFHAEDGSSVSSTVASEGLDTGDKATNKALSAAFKYALIQTFSVPTEDMEDSDRTSPEIGGGQGIVQQPKIVEKKAEAPVAPKKTEAEVPAQVVSKPNSRFVQPTKKTEEVDSLDF